LARNYFQIPEGKVSTLELKIFPANLILLSGWGTKIPENLKFTCYLPLWKIRHSLVIGVFSDAVKGNCLLQARKGERMRLPDADSFATSSDQLFHKTSNGGIVAAD